MPAAIFDGTKIKLLKSILNLNDDFDIKTVSSNPTSVATAGEPGDIAVKATATVGIWQKTDSGSTTNWTDLGAAGATLSQVYIDLTGGSGYGSTNTRIRRFTTVTSNVGSGITVTQSATLGDSFTVDTAGLWHIYYGDSGSGNAVSGVSLNASVSTDFPNLALANRITTELGPRNANGIRLSQSTMVWLSANDVLRVHGDATNNMTETVDNYVRFRMTLVAES